MTHDTLPFRHNIDAFTDIPVRRVFRWLADGSPVDLTDWTAELFIGRNGRMYTTLNNAVSTGDTDGLVSLDIQEGTLIDPGDYWYVVDLIDPNGGPVRFVHGVLRMSGLFP